MQLLLRLSHTPGDNYRLNNRHSTCHSIACLRVAAKMMTLAELTEQSGSSALRLSSRGAGTWLRLRRVQVQNFFTTSMRRESIQAAIDMINFADY